MAPNVQYPEHHQPARASRRAPQEDDDVNESWAKLAAKVGVPSAIAVFLVYRLTIGIETSQAGMRDELRSHVAATAPLIHSQQQLVNLALQSCVMQAPNKAGQTACFAALVSPPQPPAR